MLSCFCFSGGVQSTALALEIARGEHIRPDCAVNLPTDADDATTRAGVQLAADYLRAAGVPCFRLARANILGTEINNILAAKAGRISYRPLCPFWYRDARGRTLALRRQCTRFHKTRPLRAMLRRLAGISDAAGHVRAPIAEFWLGFTTDEPLRCRQPRPRWLAHRFPLVRHEYSRADCRAILDAEGEYEVIRSACIICPYRRDPDWLAMRAHNPEAYATACDFDAQLRDASPRLGKLYLHRSCRPLPEALADVRDDDPNHRGT